MGHPVTTNPFIIMLINMTVVFLVLISLSFVIRLIHVVDPTAKKAEPEPAVQPAPVAPVQMAEPEPASEGIKNEVIAAIAAALSSLGYSAGQIRAVRPAERIGWKTSGRLKGLE